MDINVTKQETFIDTISDFTVQLIFKKLQFVECWCSFQPLGFWLEVLETDQPTDAGTSEFLELKGPGSDRARKTLGGKYTQIRS